MTSTPYGSGPLPDPESGGGVHGRCGRGEPVDERLSRPSSITPAFSHLPIVRLRTPSRIRLSRKLRRWP